MELWIATGNKGKVREFELLLKEHPEVKIHTQAELSAFTPRPEDGKTFIENARIKARSVKALKSSDWVLGEDSGLEVDGLNNLPGVHSARYAGPHARDHARRALGNQAVRSPAKAHEPRRRPAHAVQRQHRLDRRPHRLRRSSGRVWEM